MKRGIRSRSVWQGRTPLLARSRIAGMMNGNAITMGIKIGVLLMASQCKLIPFVGNSSSRKVSKFQIGND